YKSLLHTMTAAFEIVPAEKGDDYVALAPPAWIAALMNEAGHLLKGLIVNYPEKAETVMEDLREISPVVNGGGPRIWEGMVSLIQAKINDAGVITRALYNLFLPVGYHVADLHLKGEKSPLGWNILYMIANRIVFRPLRDQLGFRKSKYYMTGSAALSPDTFRYFHAIGCPLRQGYASTEGGTVCGHYGDETNIRFDTIGKPNTGVKVRISPEG
ncbi:MAG: long-chain fatty acid--CoA ligase, partial [Deltaproteobacteria bacterium]|nr:long-chain fatty acid--CoA ligase [Deltaproteobacteria bacterium]